MTFQIDLEGDGNASVMGMASLEERDLSSAGKSLVFTIWEGFQLALTTLCFISNDNVGGTVR